jgi:glycine oxidase
MVSTATSADVVVIGDGLIGLSTAYALGQAGVRTVIAGATHAGAASPASAGLLVPSLGQLAPSSHPFFVRSLDRYPAFVAELARFDPELRVIQGMMVIERSGDGETHHATNGAVDNVRLLAALRAALTALSSVESRRLAVRAIERSPAGLEVVGDDDTHLAARRVVLAAGAWAAEIRGLPRPLPVRPLKGQMIALDFPRLTTPVMGENVYLVPRGSETLVGATVESAGFDTSVTSDAVAWLHRESARVCPPLAEARVTRTWAGLRPATPDMLPILGPDPDLPELIYACGHSKNGILLAPATADAMVHWCRGGSSDDVLAPFSVARFVQP